PCEGAPPRVVHSHVDEYRDRIALMLVPERRAAKLFWREAGHVSAERSGQSPPAGRTCEALTVYPWRCETWVRQRRGEREQSGTAQVCCSGDADRLRRLRPARGARARTAGPQRGGAA